MTVENPFLTSSNPFTGVAGGREDPHLSSLDNYQHNSPFLREQRPKMKWKPSQVRCYNRIRAGSIAHRGGKMRLMTLTTAKKMQRTKETGHQILTQRVRRMTPFKMFKAISGTGSFHRFSRHYYPNKNPLSKLKYEYTKVTTTEGVEGVFHIVYFGDYLPQKWVSSTWEEITGTARVVDIRGVDVQRGSEKRVSIYVVNQYVSGGQNDYVRFSNSWGWCFRGFLGVWDDQRRQYRGFDYEERWGIFERYINKQKHPPPALTFLDIEEQNPRLIYKGEGVNFENGNLYTS